MHRKLTCGSSLPQFTGLHQEALLEKFKENNLSQLFKITNKEKPPRLFSLASYILKMDAYLNDFEKIFLAKNPM